MAFKFQTKIGQGYLAVEADDYDNFVADLAQAFGQAGTDTMLEAAAKTDLTAVPERAATTRPAATSGGGSAPARSGSSGGGSAQPPADWKENPPECTHGRRRARQWERNGKQNYTWYCDLPQERRSEQCTPMDAVTGKEFGQK